MLIEGVELLAFTVQKEVGQRLRAEAGSDDYGPLSVIVQMLADVELLRTLPPQAFWPSPKVDSALVRLKRRDRLSENARAFSRFVHALFSSRRKTLRNALSQSNVPADVVLERSNIRGTLRPENLRPSEMLSLFENSGIR